MEAFSEKAPPAKKLRLGSPKDSFHFSQDCFAHHPDRSAPQHLCDIGHGQDAYEGSRHDALVYAEGIAPSAYEIGPAHAEEGNGRSDEDALVCFGMVRLPLPKLFPLRFITLTDRAAFRDVSLCPPRYTHALYLMPHTSLRARQKDTHIFELRVRSFRRPHQPR